jgi:hypothetical protein
MPRKAVVDAVEARLGATWSGLPVWGANNQGEPPGDGSEFVMVQYPVAETRRMSLGTRRYREEGAIRFVIHAQRGFGAGRALTLADDIAELFRDVTFDGVETRRPSSMPIGNDNDRGNYFVASVTVPYAFDFTG